MFARVGDLNIPTASLECASLVDFHGAVWDHDYDEEHVDSLYAGILNIWAATAAHGRHMEFAN